MLYNIIFLISSYFLYIFAPIKYSLEFCCLVFLVFLLNSAYLFIANKKYELVGFNLLFTVSFFATNYIFPLFIFRVNDQFSMFHHGYNDLMICRSTALATFAYSLYSIGYSVNSYNFCFKRKEFKFDINERVVKFVSYLLIAFFVLFVISGGLNYYKEQYLNGDLSHGSTSITMMIIMLTVLIILLCSSLYRLYKIRNVFIILLVSVIILLSGSRTIPLSVICILFCFYAKKYNFSTAKIAIIGISGLLLFAIIGLSRNGLRNDDSGVGEFGALEVFTDLIINNRNLYEEYEYVCNYGTLWGLSFLSPLLAIIPFFQSLFKMITGLPDFFMSSSSFITYQHFGADAPVGLGTNVVGDAYLGGGLVGVIILFYLLGFFVSKARNGMLLGSFKWTLFYNVILANAVFMCRSSILSPLRTLVWAYVFLYFIKLYTNKKKCV